MKAVRLDYELRTGGLPTTRLRYSQALMRAINIEIKARCADPERVRAVLGERDARFAGVDQQVDTYFHVPQGRLKLREGKIENALIYFLRH